MPVISGMKGKVNLHSSGSDGKRLRFGVPREAGEGVPATADADVGVNKADGAAAAADAGAGWVGALGSTAGLGSAVV